MAISFRGTIGKHYAVISKWLIVLFHREGPVFGNYVKSLLPRMEHGICLPLQNRELEIEQIARMWLANRKLVARNPIMLTTFLTLASSAQIRGSGKSSLGRSFLDEFSKEHYADFRKSLSYEFGTEEVHQLMNCRYLLVDFSEHVTTVPLQEVILRSLIASFVRMFPEDGNFWTNEEVKAWTPAKVVAYYSSRLRTSFFIHFDDIDQLIKDGNGEKSIHEFWHTIHPILTTKSMVYCSGETPLLHDISVHSLFKSGLHPPGNNESFKA